MKRAFSLIIISALFVLSTNAQSFWTKTKSGSFEKNEKIIDAVFHLDKNGLFEYLKDAPQEFTNDKAFVIDLPNKEGKLEKFKVWKSSIMESKIQAKYPNIQAYKAQSLDGTKSGRFDISINGFYGVFRSLEGSFYLETDADVKEEILLYSNNMKNDKEICNIIELNNLNHQPSNKTKQKNFGGEQRDLITYRIAILTSSEWAEVYLDRTIPDEKKLESIIAIIHTTINTVNEIYENDLAVRFILINDLEKIIFTNPDTDPFYDNNECFDILYNLTTIIDGYIGNENYDLAQSYLICSDLRGVAFLGSACLSEIKGAGITAWRSSGSDDPISRGQGTIAHEIGHMFNAEHTWSNCSNPEQRFQNSAYEPGSGNTILSYFGGCEENNTSGTERESYFHIHSCIQMRQWIEEFACRDDEQTIITGNTNPVASHNYPDNFYIPISTPFELKGDATDAENDPMTYKWSQYNTGPVSTLGSPEGNAPCFKTFKANDKKNRVFPKLSTVVRNQTDINEVLVDYERDFTFRFVVRDNNPEAGGMDWADVNFKTTETAGPFRITYPNERERFIIGDEMEIRWDVANTDNELVNCQKVNISYSVNNGSTFTTLLIGTPNDGKEIITVPNTTTPVVRFMVSANDNIFFDVNDAASSISVPQEPTFLVDVLDTIETLCLPTQQSIKLSTQAYQGFDESIEFEIIEGLPEGTIVSFDKENIIAGDSVTMFLNIPNINNSYDVNMIVRATSLTSGKIVDKIIPVSIIGNDFSSFSYISPTNSASEQSVFPIFSWTTNDAVDYYNIEIASSPLFGSTNVVNIPRIFENNYTLDSPLENNTLYYWRINGQNDCGEQNNSVIRAFHTSALSCIEYVSDGDSISITLFGTPTIISSIEVNEGTNIQDINVKNLDVSHANSGDLRISLKGPDRTEIVLIDKECNDTEDLLLGFDDQSLTNLSCPLSQGETVQPSELLSNFNGTSPQGEWSLIIEDLVAGDGGSFKSFSVEICGGIEIIAPLISKNNLLTLSNTETKSISSDLLETRDSNNSDLELSYTVINNVQEGILLLEENMLEVGGQFTQEDINNGRLSYQHIGDELTTDSFTFLVEDGEGGWTGMEDFNIEINFIVSNTELEEQLGLKVFPNPTSSEINISLEKSIGEFNINIINTNGQIVMDNISSDQNFIKINTTTLTTGMYFLELDSAEGTVVKKIFIVK